jgi:hypothetical protein
MATNPFTPFPKEKGPLKLFVYGDPGTEKTRRALLLSSLVSGPTYVIDMEDGASDYGDIVADGGMYLRTKSVKKVMEAMEYMSTLKAKDIGLFIGDALPTVMWQQLQAGHIAKMKRTKNQEPEDVMFDVGVWGSVKRVYGDYMTRFLHLPCPSIMTARGKEKIDGKGKALGYGYDGEKSTDFLVKTVIETRIGYDNVIKDRTGTFKEGRHNGRVDIAKMLANTGSAQKTIELDSEAAETDSTPSAHPSYAGAEVEAFAASLATLNTTIAEVSSFMESVGGASPATYDNAGRRKLVARLQSTEGAQKFLAWKAGRAQAESQS